MLLLHQQLFPEQYQMQYTNNPSHILYKGNYVIWEKKNAQPDDRLDLPVLYAELCSSLPPFLFTIFSRILIIFVPKNSLLDMGSTRIVYRFILFPPRMSVKI